MSDRPSNVVEALAAVMGELGPIGKDGRAHPNQGGYAYRGIEQITAAAQGLFAKYRVVFVPRVIAGWDVRDITVNGKPWTDTTLQVEYDVYGPGGTEDKITVGPIVAIGRDNSDKGANKCMTQALKYALLQVLCISDAKDDGDQASHQADAEDPAVPGLRSSIEAAISRLDDEQKAELKDWFAAENLPPVRRMNAAQCDRVLAHLIDLPDSGGGEDVASATDSPSLPLEHEGETT